MALAPRRQPFSRTAYSANAPSTSFADDERPDVFYHLIPPPNPLSNSLAAYAISFSSEPPPAVSSATILGWLLAESPSQDSGETVGFADNDKFREFLHETISEGLKEGADEMWINAAIQLGEGWMHITDMRNPPALGRIGDPDDIIGSVLVQEGKILPDTYQPMPSYRFTTSDGLMQLTEGLSKKLLNKIEQQARAERA